MAPKRIRGTIYLRFGQQTKLVLAGNMREYKDVVLVRVVQRHFPETCGKELDIKVDLAVPGVVITPDAWRAFADSDEAKEADMYTVELATAPQKPSPPHLPSKKIRIRLLSGCGEEVEFLCSPTTTVRKLQTGFETRMGVEAGENRLVYDGRNLWADKTVGYYGMQDGDTIDVIPELKGGKPVIYLRSPVELDATVEVGLVPEWSFSALYPVVTATNPKNPRLHQSALWSVKTATDGTMLDKQSGAHVSYLFWEALTNPITNELSPPPSPVLGTSDVFRPALARNTFKHAASVALTIEEVPLYLDACLVELGLDTEARTSFITYWLPSFLEHKHILLSFVPQSSYECSAPLTVTPTPDVVTRVFMIFRGLDEEERNSKFWEGKDERAVKMWREVVGVPASGLQTDASLFRVLEWGGMEAKY